MKRGITMKGNKQGRIITIANQKGGVGKTATAYSLGYQLSIKKKKVLLVDFDPQSNLTTCFGMTKPEELKLSIAHVLNSKATNQDTPITIENILIEKSPMLHLLPANSELAALRLILSDKDLANPHSILRDILEPLTKDYDYIIVDTGPALDILTINAFSASDEVMVVCTPQPLSSKGFDDLIRNVVLTKQSYNSNITISGVLITMYNPRYKISKLVVDDLKTTFGEDVIFKTTIPKSIKVDEATALGKTIIEYKPSNKAALAYCDFTKEFIKRTRRTN